MKENVFTGIVTILVFGLIFASGCTGPVAQNATPTVQTTNQIGTASATPTSVSTTAATLTTKTVPAMLNATEPVSNATSANETPAAPAPATVRTMTMTPKETYAGPPSTKAVEGVTGTLLIHVGSGAADGLTAYIAHDVPDVPAFDPSFDPYGAVLETKNPGYLHATILPDGNSAILNLMPGTYIAYLPDRSGGEPEKQSFTIYGKSLTYVLFEGHAAGSSGGCGC